MTARYYVRQDNKTFGPVTTEKLLDGHRNNKLQPNALISRDEQTTWKPASEVIPILNADASGVNSDLPGDGLPADRDNEKATPVEWYRATLGHQWILVQLLLWVLYGFIWIPVRWLLWGRKMTKGEANELIGRSRAPLLSYSLLAVLVVSVISIMLFQAIDPEGYEAWKQEQARVAAEREAEREAERTRLAAERAAENARREAARAIQLAEAKRNEMSRLRAAGLGQNPDCPIKLTKLSLDEKKGSTTLTFTLENTTNRNIQGIRVRFRPWNAFNEPLFQPGVGILWSKSLKGLRGKDGVYELELPGAAFEITSFYVAQVVFTDGGQFAQGGTAGLGPDFSARCKLNN